MEDVMETADALREMQVQESLKAELLEVMARWNDACFNGDAAALQQSLLADTAVLHADHLVTEHDRTGAAAVAGFFGGYFDTYQFKHFSIASAVCAKSRAVYCLWDDEDVIMKAERFDEDLPASGSLTSLSGIWRLVVDAQGKVCHVWFHRQLTREEKKHRLKHRPAHLYSDFHAKALLGPQLDLSEAAVAKMEAAAEAFSEAWRTGNVSAVHRAMAPTCHSVNPIFGERKSSREEWEQMVQDVFKFWEVRSHEVEVAVTPNSNKAFVFWRVDGVQQDTQEANHLYGLSLLVFDPHEWLITEVVGFRQPLHSEHEHIMKAGSYLHDLPAQALGGQA